MTSMKSLSNAASLMGQRSVEARINRWGKRGFVKRMRVWGKLGGRLEAAARSRRKKAESEVANYTRGGPWLYSFIFAETRVQESAKTTLRTISAPAFTESGQLMDPIL
jgi:hypothetical protein